jgi:MFS family permease
MTNRLRLPAINRPIQVGFFRGRLLRRLPRLFRASASPAEMNARHMIADIIWFGLVMGSTLTFQVVYATRLGATPFQISALTAGPALVNMLLTLPLGRWLEGRLLVPTVFWVSVVYRLAFVFITLLPLLGGATTQIWLMIAITLVAAAPQTALTIAFNNMFAELVPNEQRMRLVNIRNAMLALFATTTTLICGQILEQLPFAVNYEVVFFIGIVGSVMSGYHLGRLRSSVRAGEKQTRPVIERRFVPRVSREGWQRLRQNAGTFMPFLGAMGLFHLGQFAIVPILTPYWIRVANLTDGQVAAVNAAFFLSNFIAALIVTRWLDRIGPRRAFLLGASGMVFYAIFTGLSQNFVLLLLTQIWGGAIWPAAGVGSYNRVLEVCPVQNRATHLAAYNFVLNSGMLFGPLLASQVTEFSNLTTAMFVGAGLRLIGWLALLRWG